MHGSLILFPALLFCFAGFYKTDCQPLPDHKEISDEQQLIIGSLTGFVALENRSSLKSRATNSERAMARQFLSAQMKTISLVPIEHAYRMPNLNVWQDLLIRPFTGVNLYAVLPATLKSEEYVILGAHYDTALNCPGANDNATGVALVFSVARMLGNLENRTKNVIIVIFDQEEEDLIGSSAFAKFVKKENFSIHSVHTIDQMGWDQDGDLAIELELPTAGLESVYKKWANLQGVNVHVTKVNSTDHQSFRALGYPAVGITEEYVNNDTSPYKDSPNDTFETVNFEYLYSSTILVYR